MHRTLITLLFLTSSAFAQKGGKPTSFEFIEYPGAISTSVRGINNLGDISGSYATETRENGFTRSASGVFTSLEVPGSFITRGWGIDDAGRVVGTFFEGDPHFSSPIGFLYNQGQYTRLEYPGAEYTQAFGISASGIVGFIYGGIPLGYHGFLYANNQWIQLDVPGARQTLALGIAPNGQIVGVYESESRHGFIYTAGSYQTIDFPKSSVTSTELYAINGIGTLLGSWNDGSCSFYPFTYSRQGRFTTLDFPAAFISGINDDGYVVGVFGATGKGFIAKASAFTIK